MICGRIINRRKQRQQRVCLSNALFSLLSPVKILMDILLCCLLFIPAPAYAHVGRGEASGLLTGFLHPLSGADHMLAMVAVGLWGAQLGVPAIWVLPVAFPLVMAMGAMLGMLGV